MAELTGNNRETDELGALDEFGLGTNGRGDRLPPMLFLAALVHGILIIGVTFNALYENTNAEAVSLDVTIVADPDRSVARDDNAEYLAQASQFGAGNTGESVRPSAPPESSVPVDSAGVADARELVDAEHHAESAAQQLTTLRTQLFKVSDLPREEPQPVASRAALLEAGVEASLSLPREQEANFLVRDRNRQRIAVSADTRESGIAGYVDRWKRKIEAVGGRYIPEQSGLRGLTGSPTLEVTIDATGRLANVVIVRPSGSPVLDRAALVILRRAAPFDPFPEAVRREHPQLNFLYKWQFNDLTASSTARMD